MTERRPVKHDHLGQERIDMVDPCAKRIVCWCGFEADLAEVVEVTDVAAPAANSPTPPTDPHPAN